MSTLYNLLKKILFITSFNKLSKIFTYKNRHKGESCYIFGDGVSIKYFDLTAFPKKPSISLSFIPFHIHSLSIDLKYGLLIDPWYFYPYLKSPWPPYGFLRNNIQNIYRKMMHQRTDMDFFVSLSNLPVLNGNNITYLFKKIDDKESDFLEECNFYEESIFDGSIRFGIALAIYMGFEDITLIGCDYTHKNPRALHWYENGKGIIYPHQNYNKKYFEIAQKYAKITTVTYDDVSNILPYKTYFELTNRIPTYQENNILIDKETLRTFSEWKSYKIFN